MSWINWQNLVYNFCGRTQFRKTIGCGRPSVFALSISPIVLRASNMGYRMSKMARHGHLKASFRWALPEKGVHPSSVAAPDAFSHANGPRPWSAMEQVTVYGRRACTCPLMRTPSDAFGDPGPSSLHSSLSTPTHDLTLVNVQELRF